MSVQLIVYPQSYAGLSSSVDSSIEMIAGGSYFTGLVGNVSTFPNPVATLAQQAMTTLAPLAPNTWYGIRNTNSQSSMQLTLPYSYVLFYPDSAMVQRLSSLSSGVVYDLTITYFSNYSTKVYIFNGTTLSETINIESINSVEVVQFTAPSDNDTTIIIENVASAGSYIIIENVSVTAAVSTGSQDGQGICDLYEDEDLPLSLSVDEFKNVAEKVQSYSKAFNLPATKNNNKIFDNIFEITRSGDGIIFNPYKRTECVLKQDGLIIFQGFLRLLDASDKEGEISYNVNLYSEVIALADILKDEIIRDLDFTELDHLYTYPNIKNSWTGGLVLTSPLPLSSFANNTGVDNATTTNVLKYPFVDWAHNYELTDTNQPKLPNLESAFRPFINVKYLINRIFAATDFNFTSEFFDSIEFEKLFIDFNWGSSNNGASLVVNQSFAQGNTGSDPLGGGGGFNTYPLINNISGDNTGWANANSIYVSSVNNLEVTILYVLNQKNTSLSSKGNSIRIAQFNVNGDLLAVLVQDDIAIPGTLSSSSNTKLISGTLNIVMQSGDFVRAQASTPEGGNIEMGNFDGEISRMEFTLNSTGSQVVPLLTQLRGDLNQWELLKSLTNMFNLVTIPDENNPKNIIIEPYSSVFNSQSTLLDWTNKIDVANIKLEPLTDLNRTTIFKFAEDEDDFPSNNYENLFNGKVYGNHTFPDTPDSSFNILEGTKEISAEPFAATVVKSLMPNFIELVVPSLYSYDEEGDTTEGFDNKPRILFDAGVKTMTGTTYEVPAQNGEAGEDLENQFLQFSHLTTTPTIESARDFHFGLIDLLPNVGVGTVNNLFSIYWKPYFNELYNEDTRIMTIKVNLNAADINTFKFNFRVYIKNRTFRVNKINYKPNDLSTVEFILIP